MPRKTRLHLPGGFYHVILRGNGRQTILLDAADRAQWEDYLQQGLTRYGHRIHAYCWMTNHVHMAIQAGTDPLARFILCCTISLAAGSAFAYVGPGAGISLLGSLWGLLVAIVFVVVRLLIFPIKV